MADGNLYHWPQMDLGELSQILIGEVTGEVGREGYLA
jgi:hypothetical protein